MTHHFCNQHVPPWDQPFQHCTLITVQFTIPVLHIPPWPGRDSNEAKVNPPHQSIRNTGLI